MFTGIIYYLGKLKKIIRNNVNFQIEINCPKTFIKDIKLGDSIAVNGVCLTIISFSKNSFIIEVIDKTIQTTNLKFLKINNLVNLEKSLTYQDKINGHLVYGHVDTIISLCKKYQIKNTWIYIFKKPLKYNNLIIKNNSISLDGVSLTISNSFKNLFEVNLTPYTLANTNFGIKKIGDLFNLEIDMLMRTHRTNSL